MEVPAGKRLALTGPSGAGKSTLSALIARFYDPTEGRVLIDGRDARDCSLAWLRDQVAVVLQDTVLFTGSVRENIAYGVDATDEEIVDAARAAAAHEFIRRLPDGYETQLGPQGVGSQRRSAPADRDRAHAAAQPADHHPRRADDGARPRERGAGARGPRSADARPHVHPDHALAAARAHGRPDRDRARRGPDRARASQRPSRRGRSSSGCSTPTWRAAILERSLGPGERLGEIAVARVYYRPDGRTHLHYRAGVGDAVLTAGQEQGALAARRLRLRRGRHDHVAAVRPAAARAGRAPGRARAPARPRTRRRAGAAALQAAGPRRPALGRARAEGLREPRRVRRSR